ncbi:hypothetical protein LCGC14_1192860 [marine sediment metagenome]|uniref:Uncharacterized protein n=1 Tax=marine sediment metagenome TaxID=412755 RepID=A0A0F9P1K7_9ZZZZ
MSWTEKMKDWGGGEVAFLSEDGEAIIFIVVADPELLEGKFKGRLSERIGCPVITLEGYTLFICGKRLARRLSRYEECFDDTAFMVVRRGEHNDIETVYELSKCTDPDLTAKLFEWKEENFDATQIEESLDAAKKIITG